MKNTTLVASATVLAVALTLSPARSAQEEAITPPDVPSGIRVPDGNKAFFEGHAVGTQNYICLPAGSGFDWTLFTPQATLFNGGDRQTATHYFSPNPVEYGTVRATWIHSRDSSTVWGKLAAASSDAAYVAPGAIAWLLIEVEGAVAGPNGGDTFTATTYIHRVNTSGGVKPSTGCAGPENVGATRYVPYEADYYFYESENAE